MLLFDIHSLSALLMAALFSATPLVLAAMGGILSEKSGVVNIALEGLMLTGAFVGFAMGQTNGWLGLLCAILAGGLLGFLHALLTQRTRMNHVVSGLGINLLAAGATRYLSSRIGTSGNLIVGLDQRWFLAAAAILPFVLLALLNRTRFGLRLRSVGENPESARMAGISPGPSRYAAVTLSGMLAAMAGAYLSLAVSHGFSRDMSAGQGYIALAAVIFGKWNPVGATAGALFFSFFYAVQAQFQISGVTLNFLGVEWSSAFLLGALPFVMTLVALVSVVGRATPPAALGLEE